ncbi:MAG: hypothetical protein R3A47_07555 [Polyangiales bacterium]
MRTFAKIFLHLRRGARLSWPLISVGLFVLVLSRGAFVHARDHWGWRLTALVVAWGAVFVQRAFYRRRSLRPRLTDVEISSLAFVGVRAVVQALGGMEGPAYGLVYLTIAFVASFMRNPSGLVVVGLAIATEVLLFGRGVTSVEPNIVAMQAGFIFLFGVLNWVFTRAEIARVRRKSQKQMRNEREKSKEETRLFRLVSPAVGNSADEGRLVQSSVDEIHNSLYYVLQLLHRTMSLHTCVLLMNDESDTHLRIAELVTNATKVEEGPFQRQRRDRCVASRK